MDNHRRSQALGFVSHGPKHYVLLGLILKRHTRDTDDLVSVIEKEGDRQVIAIVSKRPSGNGCELTRSVERIDARVKPERGLRVEEHCLRPILIELVVSDVGADLCALKFREHARSQVEVCRPRFAGHQHARKPTSEVRSPVVASLMGLTAERLHLKAKALMCLCQDRRNYTVAVSTHVG
ncbi:MAG TPA: hypothetical protein VF093_03675 [Solirubrobacterales bacterium]